MSGMLIIFQSPKVLSLTSTRGILHDERLYRNAHLFLPSRFENLSREEEKRVDPTNYVYGFGRR